MNMMKCSAEIEAANTLLYILTAVAAAPPIPHQRSHQTVNRKRFLIQLNALAVQTVTWPHPLLAQPTANHHKQQITRDQVEYAPSATRENLHTADDCSRRTKCPPWNGHITFYAIYHINNSIWYYCFLMNTKCFCIKGTSPTLFLLPLLSPLFFLLRSTLLQIICSCPPTSLQPLYQTTPSSSDHLQSSKCTIVTKLQQSIITSCRILPPRK